jgi:hypothetical protein
VIDEASDRLRPFQQYSDSQSREKTGLTLISDYPKASDQSYCHLQPSSLIGRPAVFFLCLSINLSAMPLTIRIVSLEPLRLIAILLPTYCLFGYVEAAHMHGKLMHRDPTKAELSHASHP